MDDVYLDNAATTPVHPKVAEAVMKCLTKTYGNPSSLHRLGIESEKAVKEARKQVSLILEADSDEILFTSGGTESNNMSIAGTALERKRDGKHCITTVIEHPSVLATFKYLEDMGWDVTYLPVNNEGVISVERLKKSLRPDTVLVSIMHVNNEIGSIQPIKDIGHVLSLHKNKPIFHVDAIQSFGKLTLRPREWGIDLMSISGHKFHAPKGVGALFIRKGTRIQPLHWGGGQERGLRSGTENLPGIVGLGEAAHLLRENIEERRRNLRVLKNILLEGILSNISDAVLNGPQPENGAPHILSVSFPGIRSEVLMHLLEMHRVYVGTGSACSSRKSKTSHVMEAIGASREVAEGSIRISLSYMNTKKEMYHAISSIKKSIEQLRLFRRR